MELISLVILGVAVVILVVLLGQGNRRWGENP